MVTPRHYQPSVSASLATVQHESEATLYFSGRAGIRLRGAHLTTPHQRTRSVLQARKFLIELLSPSAWGELPTEIRDEARRLLYHYPEAWHVARLHDRNPEEWGPVEACQTEVSGPARRA